MKRKYNRGRCLRTVWVFGGVERDTKKKFIVPLLKDSDGGEEPENVSRSAENLVPLIKKYILPDSIIYSDKWKAYDSLSSVGYTHFSINHSEKFVEGDVHTQKVERLWRDLKEWIKRPGMKKGHLHHYIGRYLFCTSGEDREQLLHKFQLLCIHRAVRSIGQLLLVTPRTRTPMTTWLEPNLTIRGCIWLLAKGTRYTNYSLNELWLLPPG